MYDLCYSRFQFDVNVNLVTTLFCFLLHNYKDDDCGIISINGSHTDDDDLYNRIKKEDNLFYNRFHFVINVSTW